MVHSGVAQRTFISYIDFYTIHEVIIIRGDGDVISTPQEKHHDDDQWGGLQWETDIEEYEIGYISIRFETIDRNGDHMLAIQTNYRFIVFDLSDEFWAFTEPIILDQNKKQKY